MRLFVCMCLQGTQLPYNFPHFLFCQIFGRIAIPRQIYKKNYFKTEMLSRKVSLQISLFTAHGNENPIYVFLFWELRGLSPNFHIHVSVSHLYIPRIGPHIFLQQNRQTDRGNI